jgi:hypothetical protein
MAYVPVINAIATVTARDLLNNNIAKQFNAVHSISFDFDKGMVNVVDATGSFFFPISPMTSIVDTIVTGISGQHSFVMS